MDSTKLVQVLATLVIVAGLALAAGAILSTPTTPPIPISEDAATRTVD